MYDFIIHMILYIHLCTKFVALRAEVHQENYDVMKMHEAQGKKVKSTKE